MNKNDLLTIDSSGRTICKSGRIDWIYLTQELIMEKLPDILITNVYTIAANLIREEKYVKQFVKDVGIIVLDEAHVYKDILGGEVHYLLKIIKKLILYYTNRDPEIILSSATIPKPQNFAKNLTGTVSVYVSKYEDFIPISNSSGKRRIVLHAMFIPSPNYSAETLLEGFITMSTLWCLRHNFKGITFIDSVNELQQIIFYIKDIILGTKLPDSREGREIIEKLLDPDPEYNWKSIAPSSYIKQSPDILKQTILNDFKNKIGIHWRKLRNRGKIEEDFSKGKIRFLISTSTLELGIDIPDIAIVGQYKMPLKFESYIQRVGRAGRSNDTLRVALGVIILSNNPAASQFLYNPDLFNIFVGEYNKVDPKLVSRLVETKVTKRSASLFLKYALLSYLNRRAIENKPTYYPVW